jgi:hypothetical protein
MTRDITTEFEDAATRAADWTHADVATLLEAVTNEHPHAQADWEPGDEEWGRVLDPDGEHVIALICAKLPLGFIRGEAPVLRSPHRFVWISAESMDAASYRVVPEVLDRLFGRAVSRNLTYDEVSAQDIWWATVS